MFCKKCGKRVSDDDKFCVYCGEEISESKDHSESGRREEYLGKVQKCPNCGESLDLFTASCPTCNHEIRVDSSIIEIQSLIEKLERAKNNSEKIDIISSFVCPNRKDAVYEFFFLASAKASVENNNEVFEAWKIKVEHMHKKASLLFKTSDDMRDIDDILSDINAKFEARSSDIKKQKTLSKNMNWIILLSSLIVATACYFITDSYFVFPIAVFMAFLLIMYKDSSRAKRRMDANAKNYAASKISLKDRNMAFIFCVLFGYLGIHRFYVGKYISGTLYLLTLGLFGIGWIVDIIMIITGSFTDYTDRYVL